MHEQENSQPFPATHAVVEAERPRQVTGRSVMDGLYLKDDFHLPFPASLAADEEAESW